jgi:hypothetical protein
MQRAATPLTTLATIWKLRKQRDQLRALRLACPGLARDENLDKFGERST